MIVLGYIFSLLIGVSLGLIGAGGSILTVPVLVYFMAIPPVLATAYSLFIVGTTALVGSFRFMHRKQVSFKTALVFALPAFLAVFFTRLWLVPALPHVLLTWGTFSLTKNVFIMVLFAVLMLAASISMIRGGQGQEEEPESFTPKYNLPLIIGEGLLVGVLTGMVGAGGGFLIIPALVMLARLPMKIAVGTSLLVIAINSLLGFLGDVSAHGQNIQWPFLLVFTLLPVGGIFIGAALTKIISGSKLKKGFGWFVLVMGILILLKELL